MNKKITKKKHNLIDSKLKTFSVLAAGLVAFANNSKAQIIYTDVNPDVTIFNNGSYLLDLNNDGTPDFKFNQFRSAGSYGSVNSVGISILGKGNRILDTISSGIHYPPPLNLNTSIGPNLNPYKKHVWTNSQITDLNLNFAVVGKHNASYKGYWKDVEDKYLGLSIVVNNKTYYGWVRLDVNYNGSSFTIKDYAYYSIPDHPIHAGETDKTNIKYPTTNIGLHTTIYSNNKVLYVNFYNNETITGTINLLSITGQLLKTVEIMKDENHVRLENIVSGIYILNIQTTKGNLTKKIHID